MFVNHTLGSGLSMNQTDHQLKLRLPSELKVCVESAARINNRSINAEVIARLETTFSNQETARLEKIEHGIGLLVNAVNLLASIHDLRGEGKIRADQRTALGHVMEEAKEVFATIPETIIASSPPYAGPAVSSKKRRKRSSS